MTFSELNVGQEFFDPYSGDDYIKISNTEGEDSRTGEYATFKPDDEVEAN